MGFIIAKFEAKVNESENFDKTTQVGRKYQKDKALQKWFLFLKSFLLSLYLRLLINHFFIQKLFNTRKAISYKFNLLLFPNNKKQKISEMMIIIKL